MRKFAQHEIHGMLKLAFKLGVEEGQNSLRKHAAYSVDPAKMLARIPGGPGARQIGGVIDPWKAATLKNKIGYMLGTDTAKGLGVAGLGAGIGAGAMYGMSGSEEEEELGMLSSLLQKYGM